MNQSLPNISAVGIPDDDNKIVGHKDAISYVKNMRSQCANPNLMDVISVAPPQAKDLISKMLTLSAEDRFAFFFFKKRIVVF